MLSAPLQTERIATHWYALAPGSTDSIPVGEILEVEVEAGGKDWKVRLARESRVLYRDTRLFDPFVDGYADFWKDDTPEVLVEIQDDYIAIRSQGLPNHPTAEYPNSKNPNSIRAQNFLFQIPLEPKRASRITALPMGPVGVAINGVVFFNRLRSAE